VVTKFKENNFYFSDEWNETKERIKKRDGNKCTQCGISPDEWSRNKLVIHHKTQRRKGGTDTDENLITLCFVCHGKLPREIR
jgi:5-methylcytosine-specific restriction endonuclease McrA